MPKKPASRDTINGVIRILSKRFLAAVGEGIASSITPEKLRDYLLSPLHPIGRYKALFFRTLGYDETSWQQLETDLRSLASLPAEPLESTEYGTKYAIIGPLTGLNGHVAEIVTVWIILAGEDAPRFVTAYTKD